jgi:hypothetical protein
MEGEKKMSQRTLARFKFVSIVIFVIGLVSATVAFSIQKSNGKKQRHRIGFTLVTKQSTVPFVPIQNSDRYTITVRYQKSDGTWRQVRTPRNAEGKVLKRDITVGVPGQGVFKVNKDQGALDFVSSMPGKEVTSYVQITDGRNDPSYLKDDWVFGYKTYVLRFPHDDGGYVDLYCAPDLDGAVIKLVAASPYGMTVEEPIEIKLGDPDERVFGSLPNWLVNYDRFKEKIATLEEKGKHESAEALRREMAQHIAKQPDQ